MRLIVLFLLSFALVVTTLWLVGYQVPHADAQIGESYLIFFFHFPSAINCLNLFILAGVLSALYLIKRRNQHPFDLMAAAAVEVGVLACTVTLVTGSIWAKAAWGVWWDMEDKRLMTVAIMWLTYLAYLALRHVVEDPVQRARFSGVFGVIASVNVPLVWFSIRVFGKDTRLHPMKISLDAPSMKVAQWLGAAAFLLLYLTMWWLRYRVLHNQRGTAVLEEKMIEQGV